MASGVSIQAPAHLAVLALGSNQGDRRANLRRGVAALVDGGGGEVVSSSSIWASDPVDCEGGEFYNAAVVLRTGQAPGDLLALCRAVERLAGRTGSRRDARPLDLDIVYYDDLAIDGPHLTLPHPARLERPFVLAPLGEACGDAVDPVTGRTVGAEAASRRDRARATLRLVEGPGWLGPCPAGEDAA